MAQHKAPTAVTVAPLQEKSGMGLWISRYKIHLVLLLLASVVFIVVHDRLKRGEIAVRDDSWSKLTGLLQRDSALGVYNGDPTALAALAVELRDTAAGPAARFAEAQTRFRRRDLSGAIVALDTLAREHPNHPFVLGEFAVGDQSQTLIAALRKSIEDLKSFDAAHPGLIANPPPPADAPRVRLNTDKGAIVVALYTQEAPKHCENFLKLCREGFYASTKIHRSVPDFMIQGGDPNSKEGLPATWGLGGPGYKLDAEPSEHLFHFAGVLAMAKSTGDTQSSGSQFYITSDPSHSLDGQYTIFGAVVEGMDVVEKINSAPNEPNSDRPTSPVVLAGAEVL